MSKTCLYCNTPIKGRTDKKFCDADCRGAYHNRRKVQGGQIIKSINRQLLVNYRALQDCLRLLPAAAEPIDSKQQLRGRGFDPSYHTCRKIISGKAYYFTYDLGYTVLNAEEVALRSLPRNYAPHSDNGQAQEPAVEYGF